MSFESLALFNPQSLCSLDRNGDLSSVRALNLSTAGLPKGGDGGRDAAGRRVHHEDWARSTGAGVRPQLSMPLGGALVLVGPLLRLFRCSC